MGIGVGWVDYRLQLPNRITMRLSNTHASQGSLIADHIQYPRVSLHSGITWFCPELKGVWTLQLHSEDRTSGALFSNMNTLHSKSRYQFLRIKDEWLLSWPAIFHWCSTIIQGKIHHNIDQFVHQQDQKIGHKPMELHVLVSYVFGLYHFISSCDCWFILCPSGVVSVIKSYKWTWICTTFLLLFCLFILFVIWIESNKSNLVLWFSLNRHLENVASRKLK